jgi:hypothetical protein
VVVDAVIRLRLQESALVPTPWLTERQFAERTGYQVLAEVEAYFDEVVHDAGGVRAIVRGVDWCGAMPAMPRLSTLAEFQRWYVAHVLERVSTVRDAARVLGIDESTLLRFRKRSRFAFVKEGAS